MPRVVIILAAILLLLGIAPVPYGYYVFLRIVTTGVFVWGAVVLFQRKSPILPWVFIVLAIIFNPIIQVFFSREIWIGIDLVSAIILLASITVLAQNNSNS